MAEIGIAAAGQVVGDVAKSKINKNVGYFYHYHENLDALQKADGELYAKMQDERKFSAETSRSLREVGDTVKNWRSDSDKLHQKAEKLRSRNNISRLNQWSRYFTSRRASKLTTEIKEMVKSAPEFGICFDRPTTEGAKFNLADYMEFDSRLTIQTEVLKALRNDDVRMCSICGMGGIGKTMMAKKIVQIAEADGFFEQVAMVTVSQSPDFEGIQKRIIESLGLNIDGSANKLNDWLSNHRTLLILDDVWWKIEHDDFEKVGIPLASNQCKILFTSRRIDECKKMDCKQNFALGVLDDGEAWKLFMQSVGKCVEEWNLQEKARQIVDECKGLPIAIVTIAIALKDLPLEAWDDSLKKLKNSNLPGISDMEKVHLKIQVSYDLLRDKEAQSCLRLCCLFPEDYDVPVEKLVFYGWGLELLKGVDSLKEARDRVALIVCKLKSSFLLLDSEFKEHVKLHDLVRDFAIWKSLSDENPYLVICENEMEKWPENCQYEKFHAISFVCKKLKSHPVGLRCPNLKLLQLHFEDGSDELPNDFFDGMEELRVVDVHVPSKLPALTKQKALRTLLLRGKSNEMVPLDEGCVKNLEIFSLSDRGMFFSEFPVEIGAMCNLRCLRFTKALFIHLPPGVLFTYIPPGVLSKLDKLEELELSPDFSHWGLEKGGRTNASLDDIASLPLTSITISLRKGSILPENILKSIKRFRIHIGSAEFEGFDFYSNLLVVRDLDACNSLVEWTSSLLGKCHRLVLENVDLKYIMSQLLGGNNGYQTECFSQLKTLRIKGMNCLEEIVNGTYLSNAQQPCFANLTKIWIENCPKLKRAFPLSVARELTQLESMELRYCREMEAVFYDDQGDTGNQTESGVQLNATSKGKQPNNIRNDQNMEARIEKVGEREVEHAVVLPRLKRLRLNKMPELRVLDNGNLAIKCKSLESLNIIKCNDIERLIYGSGKLRLDNMKGHLKNITKWLPIQRIKELRIEGCHEMKYLADATEDPTFLITLFSNLEELCISEMDSLEEIWHGPDLPKIHTQFLNTLTVLKISDCPKMKHVFPLSVATELRQLQEMEIVSCKETEEIFYSDPVDDGNQVASSVRLDNLTVEKSSICCPTPTSFIQCLQRKGTQPKHLPSHQNVSSVELNSPTASAPPYSSIPSHQIVEENIEKADEKEVDQVIVWPRLVSICLSGMPKLRVMYNGNHAIECPSLEELKIVGCYNMECLSHGSISAPKTKKLSIQGEKIWTNTDSCNDVVIPQLQELDISCCHEMRYLVDAMTDRNLPKTLFCNLKELGIAQMDSLEEIWNGPYLSTVQPQPCFSHLTRIYIELCPKLKHVFPLSVAMELTQLQDLVVESCEEMEEIFYEDQVADGNQNASSVELSSSTASAPPYSFVPTHQEVDGATVDATIFPRLEFLWLGSLAKLRIFYDGNHAIELPSLESMTIKGCDKMEALSNGSFKAPQLQEITINGVSYPCWEDLNTTVKKTLDIDELEEKDEDGDENEDTASDTDEDDEDGDENEDTASDTDEDEYP